MVRCGQARPFSLPGTIGAVGTTTSIPPNVAQWPNDGTSYSGTQFRYGPRVPCLVVSPYAKKGYISKNFHSHVSVVKFCLRNFNLPPLGALDSKPGDKSDDMADCFDLTQKPLPPPVL